MKQQQFNSGLAIAFVVASFFDFMAAYMIYLKNSAFFIAGEANFLVTYWLGYGLPFWFNPIILINFGLVTWFWHKEKGKENISVFWATFLLLGTLVHIVGGFSAVINGWWIL